MNGKPPHTPWLSPYFIVNDISAAINFYQKAFGFTLRMEDQDEHGTLIHAELEYHDQLIMMGKAGIYEGVDYAPPAENAPSNLFLYVYCEDVEALFTHAIAQGATAISKPQTMPWGDLMCRLKDPNGYIWSWASSLPGARCSQ